MRPPDKRSQARRTWRAPTDSPSLDEPIAHPDQGRVCDDFVVRRCELGERAEATVLALEVRIVPPASFLRPPAGVCRRASGQYEAGPSVEHARGPIPFLANHE